MKKVIFLLFITSCFYKKNHIIPIYKVSPEDKDKLLDEAKVSYFQEPNVESLNKLLSIGIGIDEYIDEEGDTFLTHAVKKKDANLIENLLEKGADVNKKNREGDAPLHIAVIYQDENLVRIILSDPKIRPGLFSERGGELYKSPYLLAKDGGDMNIRLLLNQCISNKHSRKGEAKLAISRARARAMIDDLKNNGEFQ